MLFVLITGFPDVVRRCHTPPALLCFAVDAVESIFRIVLLHFLGERLPLRILEGFWLSRLKDELRLALKAGYDVADLLHNFLLENRQLLLPN